MRTGCERVMSNQLRRPASLCSSSNAAGAATIIMSLFRSGAALGFGASCGVGAGGGGLATYESSLTQALQNELLQYQQLQLQLPHNHQQQQHLHQ